jgi:hypothetical protein
MLIQTLPRTAWIRSTSPATRTYGCTCGIRQGHNPRYIQGTQTPASTPQPTATQHTPRTTTDDAPHRSRGAEPPAVIQHAIRAPAPGSCSYLQTPPTHGLATVTQHKLPPSPPRQHYTDVGHSQHALLPLTARSLLLLLPLFAQHTRQLHSFIPTSMPPQTRQPARGLRLRRDTPWNTPRQHSVTRSSAH